jgi:crossover junction endodeoxyribonuclease RusA
MIEAIVKIRPVSKGRPRLGRRRKAYTPDRTVQFEAEVARQFREQHPDMEPLTGPVGMQVVFGSDHIEVRIWELEESHRPKYVTGDVDNYQKSLADSLNGVAYVDDKQVHYMELFFTKEEA